MTLPVQPRRAGPYSGNGSATAFSFQFRILDAEHVRAFLRGPDGVEQELVRGRDFSVRLNPNQLSQPGGFIDIPPSPADPGSPPPQIPTPLGNGYTLAIVSGAPLSQAVDFTSTGRITSLNVENALDALAIQIQQIGETVGRAMTVSPTSGETPEEVARQLQEQLALVSLLVQHISLMQFIGANMDGLIQAGQLGPELDGLTTIANDLNGNWQSGACFNFGSVTATVDCSAGDHPPEGYIATLVDALDSVEALVGALSAITALSPHAGDLGELGPYAADIHYLAQHGLGTPDDITGLITAGDNVNITGSGSAADPYKISSSGGGGGGGAVSSVNQQVGDVVLGASDVGAVPTTRTVNGLPLSQDINLTATNVGAIANITGLVTQGSNVSISGSGTSADPYKISATSGGNGGTPGAVTSVNSYTGDVTLDGTDIDSTLADSAASSSLPAAGVASLSATLQAFRNFSKWVLSKINALGSAATKDVPSSGDAVAGEVVLGDDSRLSDDRNPLSHSHSPGDVTDLENWISQKGFVKTDTTYSLATKYIAGLVKLGSSTLQPVAANIATDTPGRTYALQRNSNGEAVVNVPWTDSGGTTISEAAIKNPNSQVAGTITGQRFKQAFDEHAGGFLTGIPQVLKVASYTTTLADAGKAIDTTGNVTLGNVAYPIGTCITVVNHGVSYISISAGAAYLRFAGEGSLGSRTLAPYGVATLRKVDGSGWFISGVGLS